MLKIIAENPFRILGIAADSRPAAINAAAGRLNVFIASHRECTSPYDFTARLGEPVRTAATVQKAKNELALPSSRIRYAQFWPVQAETEAAMAHNVIFNLLLEGKYQKASECATDLYGSHAAELSELLAPGAGFSSDRLLDNFFGVLGEEGITVEASSAGQADVLARQTIQDIDSLINEAQGSVTDFSGPQVLAQIDNYTLRARPLMATLAGIYGAGMPPEAVDVADRLVMALRGKIVDYYNSHNNPALGSQCMLSFGQLMNLDLPEATRTRLENDINDLRKIINVAAGSDAAYEQVMALKESIGTGIQTSGRLKQTLIEISELMDKAVLKSGVDQTELAEDIAAAFNNAIVRGINKNAYRSKEALNEVYQVVDSLLNWPLTDEARAALTSLRADIWNTFQNKFSTEEKGCGQTLLEWLIGFGVLIGIRILIAACS